jgi:hypothetical protein
MRPKKITIKSPVKKKTTPTTQSATPTDCVKQEFDFGCALRSSSEAKDDAKGVASMDPQIMEHM